MSARIEEIRRRLAAAFAPQACELEDESHLHAGHAGAASGAGHFRLRIVSDRFASLNRIARHRLVYDSLGDMMTSEIHALNIIALAPSEVE